MHVLEGVGVSQRSADKMCGSKALLSSPKNLRLIDCTLWQRGRESGAEEPAARVLGDRAGFSVYSLHFQRSGLRMGNERTQTRTH